MEKLQIAKAVRKASEIYAKKHASELIEPTTLCGMCAISSYALLEIFKKNNIPAILHEINLPPSVGNDMHVYLVCEKDEVWDITASQFWISRDSPIKKAKIPQWIYSARPYKIHKELDDLACWQDEQKPTRERVDELLSYVELEDESI